jgi:DUF4097 and DUF4098 domain-containing protein YvlB
MVEETTMRTIVLAIAPWLASAALAGEPVNESLDAAAEGQVRIEVVRGRVEVVGWAENRVTVEGTRDDQSEAFVVNREGDTVTIEDRLARNVRGGEGTRITVRVPEGSRLRVSSVSADLSAESISGAVSLQTVSGDIDGTALGGEVEISTVSGDVELTTEASRLHVRSTSGDLLVDNRTPLTRGRIDTVSGDVELKTGIAGDGDLELESVSGDITLGLRGEQNARIEIVAGPGSSIRNRLTDQQPERPRYGPGERLEMTLGAGGGFVRMSSVSGRLALERG